MLIQFRNLRHLNIIDLDLVDNDRSFVSNENKFLTCKQKISSPTRKHKKQKHRKRNLTKQQFQTYWEKKFGCVWIAICEICGNETVDPNNVDIVFITNFHSTQIQLKYMYKNVILSCHNCAVDKMHEKWRYNKLKSDVWITFNNSQYVSKCFCCRSVDLKFLGTWENGHNIAAENGGKMENRKFTTYL
jgi:hypothetical protein